VLSSATTGCPAARAAATSGCTCMSVSSIG
jgi:hypothetical protein